MTTDQITTKVISRARTWVIKLDVRGAPAVKRDYSEHWIVPDRVEISYLTVNGRVPVVSTVRLTGVVTGKTVARRLEALYFRDDEKPGWVSDLVEEHMPRRL